MRFERGELQARLAGVGVELERSGADDGVIGDELRGFEIALDALVLHELHVAEVREALAADRVARRVDADLDVDAGQIANRVGVFGAGQPPDRDARRARRRASASYAFSEARIQAAAAVRSASVGCSSASSGGIMPVSSMSATFSHSCQCSPIENCRTSFSMLSPAFRLLGAVALEAVFLEGRRAAWRWRRAFGGGRGRARAGAVAAAPRRECRAELSRQHRREPHHTSDAQP